MIKGIMIDLDGVYFSRGKDEFIKRVVETFQAEEEVVRTVFLSSDQMKEYKSGKINDAQYWNYFIEHTGVSATGEELLNILIDSYEINERIEALVKALKEKEYTLIICTNNFPARVQGLDEKFHFLQYFDITVYSYEEGLLKPDPLIYEKAMEKSDLSADEILVVDNGQENIRTLKSLGFAVIWYEGYLELMEDLEKYEVKV